MLHVCRYSTQLRVGQTLSSPTNWVSDTSLQSKIGTGIGGSLPVIVTLGSGPGSQTDMASYNSVTVSSVSGVNGPCTSVARVLMSGACMGTCQISGIGSVGTTRVQATSWISDTSLLCIASSGLGVALKVSATLGAAVGTFLNSFSYDLPTISSYLTESRTVQGSWCAYGNYSTCYCQGIVSFVSSGESLGSNLVDSVASVTCDSGVSGSCFCFNLPFSGGQHVTILGQNFGVADFTPTSSAPATSAQYTIWVSQSSLICSLPECTDCDVSTSQSMVVAVAGQSSLSTNILIPYSFVSTRRRGFPSTDIDVPYHFEVHESKNCPFFWLHDGNFTLKMVMGTMCRKAYDVGDNIKWTIDPCSEPDPAFCNFFQIDENTVALAQVILKVTEFKIGPLDRFIVYSCVDPTCSTYSIKADSKETEDLQGFTTSGNPYIQFSWISRSIGVGTAGWSVQWNQTRGRLYKQFSSPMSQADASAACIALEEDGGGWQLASITSIQEQLAVAHLAKGKKVWIGLVRSFSSQDEYHGSRIGSKDELEMFVAHRKELLNHSWLDGSVYIPVPFTNWKGRAGTTGCIILDGSTTQSLWMSMSCDALFPFVCSKF